MSYVDEIYAKGSSGRIIMKMNSVTDVDFIEKVCEASQAGVKIDLIVRGICCVLPGVEGYTDHVAVTSIVGRYLEHPRIFSFGTGEAQKIYIGSADMMTRNTEKRVEVACPIMDTHVKHQINHYLDVMLADNLKARVLQSDGNYVKKEQKEPFVNSQERFMREAVFARKAYAEQKPNLFKKLKHRLKR